MSLKPGDIYTLIIDDNRTIVIDMILSNINGRICFFRIMIDSEGLKSYISFLNNQINAWNKRNDWHQI